MNMNHDKIAALLLDAAIHGAVALYHCEEPDRVVVSVKSDQSPVCDADHASDDAVKARLSLILPHLPVVSEETASACHADCFLLLDPLDGTREFLAGGDEYAVLLAYIEDGRARAGAIVAPRLGLAWSGGMTAKKHIVNLKSVVSDNGRIIRTENMHVRPCASSDARGLVSRLHGDEASNLALARFGPGSIQEASSAIKFALIAEGSAQIQIRLAPMMEWDAAAGDALIHAAGGVMAGLDGKPLFYGKKGSSFINPPFIAAASQMLFDHALDAAHRDN
jgi:3'(2'), 5'-bisphosphate nucleotidase